tara:strand:- start:11738 stop:11968 length:231 start_codon:yes stop_codon:yes gene_type:complete
MDTQQIIIEEQSEEMNKNVKKLNSKEFWNNEGWKNHIQTKCKNDGELACFVISNGELNKNKSALFYEIATNYVMEN